MPNEAAPSAVPPFSPTTQSSFPYPDNAPRQETHGFSFTGSGKEYFRIWIVNLLLTVATLGIYSAWAKVRRLQYFNRNTRFSGAVFDFHGDPKAILKGRLAAVALLGTYHYAFGFSKVFGVVVFSLLILGLPWMLRSSLQFRLRNTSYRALRFNFSGSLPAAYSAYLPLALTFLLPGVLLALFPTKPVYAGIPVLLYLGWPIMHARIKRYQHSHLEYGGHRSSFLATNTNFFAIYFLAFLLAILAAFIGSLLFIFGGAVLKVFDLHTLPTDTGWGIAIMLGIILFSLVLSYLCYLLVGPYIEVRIFNLVWTGTRFPHMAMNCKLRLGSYFRLQLVNTLLTMLTLGLYRPFAVVRVYQYRLAHMAVTSTVGFEEMAGDATQQVGAGGDSTAEFLGFDLSF